MVISKKPTKKVDNKLIEQILEKGGSSTTNNSIKTHDKNESIKVTIRLPKKMLDIIDDHIQKDICSKARNVWIKEAIEQKIKNEILSQTEN